MKDTRWLVWAIITDASLHVILGSFALWHLAPAIMRLVEAIQDAAEASTGHLL